MNIDSPVPFLKYSHYQKSIISCIYTSESREGASITDRKDEEGTRGENALFGDGTKDPVAIIIGNRTEANWCEICDDCEPTSGDRCNCCSAYNK